MKKVTTKKGNKVTLLNPSEKGRKACDELKNGIKLTNDGHIKFDKFGKAQKLTDTEASYRSGYVKAQQDSARAFKHNQKKQGK